MEKAKVWFIRMSLDPRCNVMACGNTSGQVYLWDVHSLTSQPQAVLSRETPISKHHGKSTSKNVTVRLAHHIVAVVILNVCVDCKAMCLPSKLLKLISSNS